MIFAEFKPSNAIYIEPMPEMKRQARCRKEVTQRYLKAAGIKKLPKGASLHHADWDRNNDRPDNCIIAKNEKQHQSWHRQLMNWVKKCVDAGLLKFDLKKLQYFTDDQYVINKILDNIHSPKAA